MLNEGLLKSLTLLHSQPLGMRQRLLWQRLKQCVWLTSDKRAETPQSLKDSCSMEEVMAQNDLRFPSPETPPDVWLWCLIPHYFCSTGFNSIYCVTCKLIWYQVCGTVSDSIIFDQDPCRAMLTQALILCIWLEKEISAVVIIVSVCNILWKNFAFPVKGNISVQYFFLPPASVSFFHFALAIFKTKRKCWELILIIEYWLKLVN